MVEKKKFDLRSRRDVSIRPGLSPVTARDRLLTKTADDNGSSDASLSH